MTGSVQPDPGLQRYVIAQVELWEANRQAARASEQMRREAPAAREALGKARSLRTVELLNGCGTFRVFYDEAGIVVLPEEEPHRD